MVDVDNMLKTGDWSKNILLEPNDVVYVPPTPAAWLGHKLAEIFFPVGPLVQAYAAPAYLRDIGDVYDDENNNTFRYGSGSFGRGF